MSGPSMWSISFAIAASKPSGYLAAKGFLAGGGEQPLLYLLETLAPVHAQDESGDLGRRGYEHPLAQREALLARRSQADRTVAGGAAYERTPFALRLRRQLSDDVGRAGNAGGSKDQEQHRITL